MFTKDDLAGLLGHEGVPCISIFMPAHRAGPDIRQDPIRFRNLLSEAEAGLRAAGIRAPEARDFLAGAASLLEDGRFWRYQDAGFALFIARDFFDGFAVPLPLDELVVVAERFHVKPLLPLLAADGTFYVLSFDQSHVRFFEGSRRGLHEITSDMLAEEIAEAPGEGRASFSLGFHGMRPPQTGSGGLQTAKFHSLGESPDDYRRDEAIAYVRRIARAVDEQLSCRDSPLVLVAPAHFQGFYRKASTYKALVGQGIEKHPGALGEDDLHREAYALVRPIFDKARQEAADRLRARLGDGDGRVCNRLEEIIPAARFGRVDTLFIATDQHRWGRFDRATNRVLRHESRHHRDEDLLDLAAAETLLNRGTVYTALADEIPGNGAAAAILRY